MTLGCCKESNQGSFLFLYINFYEAPEGVLFFCEKTVRMKKRWLRLVLIRVFTNFGRDVVFSADLCYNGVGDENG